MSYKKTSRNVYIFGAYRTPFAVIGKQFADLSTQDLLTAVLDGLSARFDLQSYPVDEVIGGSVLKSPHDFNLTRNAVVASALPNSTPSFDITQACITGAQTIFTLADKIGVGTYDSGIAAGADSASTAPLTLSLQAQKTLLNFTTQKTRNKKLKNLTRLSFKDLRPEYPSTAEPETGLSMGEHQALNNIRWNISRYDQDKLAFDSHEKYNRAWKDNFFDDIMGSLEGVSKDTNVRADPSLEKLASLGTVFGHDDQATLTAGNSTALADGAASVLLGEKNWADHHHIEPLAEVIDTQISSVDFVASPEDLLMGPAYATAKLLTRNNMSFDDFDFIEIHEAFAGTVLALRAAWEDHDYSQEQLGLEKPLGAIDPQKLNVTGSSLATGHPFAATGGRIFGTAAQLVFNQDQKNSDQVAKEQRDPSRALICICAAGGQGAAAIIESVPRT